MECHIGPGATWFAKSKLSGTRQLLAVTFNTLLAADPIAGGESAAGARHVRAVPLAGQIPRRQDPPHCANTRDDEKNTESVTTLQMHVGGGSERRDRSADSLARGCRQRDRIRRDRRQAAGDPVGAAEGSQRRACRSGHAPRCHARAAGERRAPADGLHGLPQPSEPPVRGDRRARCDLAIANGESRRTLPFVRREAVKVLKQPIPTQDAASAAIARGLTTSIHVERADASRSSRRDPGHCRCAARLRSQRVPDMKVTVRHLPEQPGPPGFPRLFPLPRRQPQGEGRHDHQPGLRALSQDGELTRRAAGVSAGGQAVESGA